MVASPSPLRHRRARPGDPAAVNLVARPMGCRVEPGNDGIEGALNRHSRRPCRVPIGDRSGAVQFASLFAPYGGCPKFLSNIPFAKVRR